MSRIEQVFEAAQGGETDRLRELLAQDASLATARNEQGVSLLMQALYYRQEAVVKQLLDLGFALSLHEAASVERVDRIEALVTAEPESVSAFSPDGFTALHFAAFFGNPDGVELLLRHKAALNVAARNPTAVAPLNSAVAGGSPRAVELLLEAGAEPDRRQAEGLTALMGAAFAGNAEMVDLLLQHGADRSLTDDKDRTAAQLAAEQGHTSLVEKLR
jgi:ankyrin repeat protein